MCAMERNEQVHIPDIEELLLEPGGFIEAELRGFEYAYESGAATKRLNLIRLGRAQQPANSSGLLVSTHSGWVAGGLFPLKTYSDSTIDVKVIRPEDAKLDLSVLFNDSTEDDEIETEHDDRYDIDESIEDDEDE